MQENTVVIHYNEYFIITKNISTNIETITFHCLLNQDPNSIRNSEKFKTINKILKVFTNIEICLPGYSGNYTSLDQERSLIMVSVLKNICDCPLPAFHCTDYISKMTSYDAFDLKYITSYDYNAPESRKAIWFFIELNENVSLENKEKLAYELKASDGFTRSPAMISTINFKQMYIDTIMKICMKVFYPGRPPFFLWDMPVEKLMDEKNDMFLPDKQKINDMIHDRNILEDTGNEKCYLWNYRQSLDKLISKFRESRDQAFLSAFHIYLAYQDIHKKLYYVVTDGSTAFIIDVDTSNFLIRRKEKQINDDMAEFIEALKQFPGFAAGNIVPIMQLTCNSESFGFHSDITLLGYKRDLVGFMKKKCPEPEDIGTVRTEGAEDPASVTMKNPGTSEDSDIDTLSGDITPLYGSDTAASESVHNAEGNPAVTAKGNEISCQNETAQEKKRIAEHAVRLTGTYEDDEPAGIAGETFATEDSIRPMTSADMSIPYSIEAAVPYSRDPLQGLLKPERCDWYGRVSDFLLWAEDMEKHEDYDKLIDNYPLLQEKAPGSGGNEIGIGFLREFDRRYPGHILVLGYILPQDESPDILLIGKSDIMVMELYDREPDDYESELLEERLKTYESMLSDHECNTGKTIITAVLSNESRTCMHKLRTGYVEKLEGSSWSVSAYRFMEFTGMNKTGEGTLSDSEAESWICTEVSTRPGAIDHVIDYYNHLTKNDPIKYVRADNVKKCEKEINSIIEESRDRGLHTVILITGIPGSGKTFIGIDTAYGNVKKITNNGEMKYDDSLYFSGNIPLVEVMQKRLKNSQFIRSASSLMQDYFKSDGPSSYPQHVFVYDEAQRSYDEKGLIYLLNKNKKKRNIKFRDPEVSQIYALLDAFSSDKDWSVLLALIGDDQELMNNDHGSVQDWAREIWLFNDRHASEGRTWNVACPEKYENEFRACNTHGPVPVKSCVNFHLSKYQRKIHFTNRKPVLNTKFTEFIDALLSGDPVKARNCYRTLRDSCGYRISVLKDREKAEEIVKKMYKPKSRTKKKNKSVTTTGSYGYIYSSKADNELADTINADRKFPLDKEKYNDRNYKNVQYSTWYDYTKPANSNACTRLNLCNTEFGCQGLELDTPILIWSADMKWKYENEKGSPDGRFETVDRWTRNRYRVLLTRARRRLIILVPDMPVLQETYRYLKYITE